MNLYLNCKPSVYSETLNMTSRYYHKHLYIAQNTVYVTLSHCLHSSHLFINTYSMCSYSPDQSKYNNDVNSQTHLWWHAHNKSVGDSYFEGALSNSAARLFSLWPLVFWSGSQVRRRKRRRMVGTTAVTSFVYYWRSITDFIIYLDPD